MNNKVIKHLVDFGLNEKEAILYLTLLKFGTHPVSYIAKRSEINRGTTYQLLHQLLEKGLVTKTSKAKIQYFSPSDPDRFKLLLENKEKEIQEKKKRIEQVMPQLAAMMGGTGEKPKVQYCSGVDGVRTAMNDYLNATDKTLRSFLTVSEIDEFVGAEFFYEHTLTRIRRGYNLRTIRAYEKDIEALKKDKYVKLYGSSEEGKRVLRYLPHQYAPPMTMYMYDNKVVLISSKEENYALIIESREFCDMQKNFFEYIWQTLPDDDNKIGA